MSNKIKIGVIDSGIDELIIPNVVHAYKSGYGDFADRLGHGTTCARIILDQCADCEIYNLKVFDRILITNANNIINAIYWCIENDIRLINLSLSITHLDYYYEFYEVCEYALQKNVLIIASADNMGRPCLPAYLENVLGVGIADLSDKEEFFYTNDNIQLYANGYDTDSLLDYKQTGTSFATARMTGMIANLLVYNPDLTYDALKTILEQKAVSFDLDKVMQKSSLFDFSKQKNPVEICNNCDPHTFGIVSFIGMKKSVDQIKRYKDFLLFKKINFIEIKPDISYIDIRKIDENYDIQPAGFEQLIQESDSLIIDEIPEKFSLAIVEQTKKSDKKILFLNRGDYLKYRKFNINCNFFYSEFRNINAIVDQLDSLPAGYIIKNKIPIMLLINISCRSDMFEIELKLKQKLYLSAYKANWISCQSKSILFGCDFSFVDMDIIPQNIQMSYVKCVVDTINQKNEDSNLIVASVNSFIPISGASEQNNLNTLRDISLALGLSPDFIVCVIDDTMELEQIIRHIDTIKHFLHSDILLIINDPILSGIDAIELPEGFDRNKLLQVVSCMKKVDLKYEIESRENIRVFNIDQDMDMIIDSIINS